MKAILSKPILGSKTLTLKPVFVKYGKLTVAEMKKTTATWNDTEPTFETEIDGDTLTVGPTDDEDGDIWRYLEEGTEVRYAIMTEDFEPKTTPNVVGSSAGVGGLAFIDLDNPQPGIESRNWTEIIGDELEPKFTKDVQKYLKRTLRTF